MGTPLDRRQFLRLAALSAGGLAFRPMPPIENAAGIGLARVAASWITVYSEPSARSRRLGRLTRDAIVTLLARERADDGPAHNPLWYRLADGYAHSGNLQNVRWLPQRPTADLPEGGAVFEISVPFTRTHRQPDPASDPLYRLYYQSTHWVEELVTGADGQPWYAIYDDVVYLRYYVRAEHLRRVPPQELSPISPEVPPRQKRIEVSLRKQELMAFEGRRLVFRTRISTGIPDSRPRENGIPTITPDGVFSITKKTPVRHMGNGRVTADLEAYELPGVPWVSFFHETGVAFHGTYWHSDFGIPRSAGCVNMRPEEARWLYRWSSPTASPGDRLTIARGTTILVG